MRLLAATNAELSAHVLEETFREDLYYRLNTVEIHLPPLRDRCEYIVPLAEYFLANHRARYERTELTFSAAAALGLMRMLGGIIRAAVDCQSARTTVLGI